MRRNTDNFNKYFSLMALLFATVTGFLLLLVILFYVFKLFAVTLFYIPGFENVFQFIITITPYAIFFCGYYYMHTKIPGAKTTAAKLSGRLLMIFGSLICFISMIMAVMVWLQVKNPWVETFNANSHWAFITQIIFLFATAAMIATGDAKEKNWMERGKEI